MPDCVAYYTSACIQTDNQKKDQGDCPSQHISMPMKCLAEMVESMNQQNTIAHASGQKKLQERELIQYLIMLTILLVYIITHMWYYPRQLITLECIIFSQQQQTQCEGRGLMPVEMEPPEDKWKRMSSTCFSEEGEYQYRKKQSALLVTIMYVPTTNLGVTCQCNPTQSKQIAKESYSSNVSHVRDCLNHRDTTHLPIIAQGNWGNKKLCIEVVKIHVCQCSCETGIGKGSWIVLS